MIWVGVIVAVLVVLGVLGMTGRLPGTSRRRSAPRPSSRPSPGRAGRTTAPGGRAPAGATRPGTRPGGGPAPHTTRGTGTGSGARDGGRGRGPGRGTDRGTSGGTSGGTGRGPGGGRSAGGAVTQADPRPGEIWWADVPYEDGPGHKVRPCVVLRTHRGGAEVLKITSQDRSDRSDHVEIPTRTWDPDADHNSFLDLTGPVRVPVGDFQDKVGTLDARIWRQVCRLHEITPN
ncbi:type II toxin-antitoxin system PemK/MazF family toxin [Microbispora hainanensis]|uniref:type II toxin-antitoxin system PemK/MazF family toxin n=1 Tax=Microbispora hainanensis TaxID=568844 RepID=UPI002E2A2B79|nr:type II toxin-antitoxin system PemK/MazF family toxin [Microbispora hainanensis]